jgi:hypothetical protein
MDVQGFDCADVGLGEGPLLCSPETCTFDISACSEASTTGPSSSTGDSVCPDPDPNGGMCGNGVIDLGEQCDGANLQGFDCPSLGLGNGTLCCDPLTCTFDTSACTG